MTEGTTRAADGAPLAWRAYGADGPAMLILHGGGRAAEHYDALARALSARLRVVVLDRRGRGRSGPLRAVPSMEGEVDDVARVLDDTGATHVFGHSAGARIALELARGRALASLSLYEPPLTVPRGWEAAFVDAVRAGRRGEAMRRFLRGLRMAPKGPWPDWSLDLVGWGMLHGAAGDAYWALLETVPYDLALAEDVDAARYAGIGCPLLAMGGAESPAYLQDAVAALVAAVPGARRAELPGQGHNAPDMTAPDAVARSIRAFLPFG